MSDTFGLITEYVRRIGESRRNAANPVDPEGHPISDELRMSNQYGPAIPTMALQQFAPNTKNATVLKTGKPGPISYSAKTYKNLPQSSLQTLHLIATEITRINKDVNRMIQLRGEKAYEIVSGRNAVTGEQESAPNDLRKNAMTRRDNASRSNSWFIFFTTVVIAFWLFTTVYLMVSGQGTIVSKLQRYAMLAVFPAVLLLMAGYGYFFIPGYAINLPPPGPSADQMS